MANNRTYTMKELEKRTDRSRATLNVLVRDYRIKARYVGPVSRRRGARKPPRTFNEENLKQIALIIALKDDVVFYPKEIKSILQKVGVDNFVDLLVSKPFPELLKRLKQSRASIEETASLQRLLDLSKRR